LDSGFAESAFACLMAVIFPIIIPWGYVIDNYIRKRGDAWWGANA